MLLRIGIKISQLLIKRVAAYGIDLIIIVSYAALLYLGMNQLLLHSEFRMPDNPFARQAIAFALLTLPVLIYSCWTEIGAWKGTPGKRMQKLEVMADQNSRIPKIIFRNILKYLPWEMAHTGVHWIVEYSERGVEAKSWVWMVLIVTQVVVWIYLISLIWTRGRRTLYDRVAGTSVGLKAGDRTKYDNLKP